MRLGDVPGNGFFVYKMLIYGKGNQRFPMLIQRLDPLHFSENIKCKVCSSDQYLLLIEDTDIKEVDPCKICKDMVFDEIPVGPCECWTKEAGPDKIGAG